MLRHSIAYKPCLGNFSCSNNEQCNRCNSRSSLLSLMKSRIKTAANKKAAHHVWSFASVGKQCFSLMVDLHFQVQFVHEYSTMADNVHYLCARHSIWFSEPHHVHCNKNTEPGMTNHMESHVCICWSTQSIECWKFFFQQRIQLDGGGTSHTNSNSVIFSLKLQQQLVHETRPAVLAKENMFSKVTHRGRTKM